MKKVIFRSVDVLDSWQMNYENYEDYEDYEDCENYMARIRIGENDKEIGELVVRYEWNRIVEVVGKKDESEITKKEIEMAISVMVLNEDFETYKAIPKISQCSELMKELYDNVCESDSSMCFIEEEDENFTSEKIEELKKEVEKYGLQDIIRFNEDDCLVTAYGDLELCFIDDRGVNNG